MSVAAAAGRTSLSLAELCEHPLVLLSRDDNAPHREQLDRVLVPARHTVRQEAHDKRMLLSLVRAGVGATLLPRHVAKALPEGVVAVAVSDLREEHRLVAAWRSDEPSIAGHAFVEIVARELAGELPREDAAQRAESG
jgi:DNA-binding transcriptional LysR family regulator